MLSFKMWALEVTPVAARVFPEALDKLDAMTAFAAAL